MIPKEQTIHQNLLLRPAELADETFLETVYAETRRGAAGDTFPAPAPAAPYGSLLSVYNGVNPNGMWRLYVVDDQGLDIGNINGGWTLRIMTNNCQQIMTPNLFESVNQATQIDALLNFTSLKFGNGAIF